MKKKKVMEFIPTPGEIYLLMKEKFESEQDKVEKLYNNWKNDESIILDKKVEIRQPKVKWLKYILWFVMFLSISVLADEIYPFYPDNIRELLIDNISRFVVLFILLAGWMVARLALKTMQGSDSLSPNRIYYTYKLNKTKKEKEVKKKTFKSRVLGLLSVITLISLFLLGYIWSLIIPLIIVGIMSIVVVIVLGTKSDETEAAFEAL